MTSKSPKKKSKKNKKCKLKSGQKLNFQKVLKSGKTALIIENVQNCFFSNGSMGFLNNEEDDNKFIKIINYLINLEENNDKKYKMAGKSGKKSKKLMNTITGDKSYFDTGSRKKFYFDIIIFSCIVNRPDSFNFASHHYLRNSSMYKPYIHPAKKYKSTYYIPGNNEEKKYGMKKIVLTPDHALSDGSDFYKKGSEKIRGVDLHRNIDKNSLYRPFSNLHNSAFINKSFYNNRGFILNKGGDNTISYSSFKNADGKKTKLGKFLKCNGVNSVFICGVGKENYVLNTLEDSGSFKNIKQKFVILDAIKNIGLEVDDSIITKKIKKDLTSTEILPKKNSYVKKINKLGGSIITTDILMELTNSEKLFNTMEQPSTIGSSLNSLGTLFSQPKQIKINNELFQNKIVKKTKKKTNL